MLWSPGVVALPLLFCAAPLVAQNWWVLGAALATGGVLLGWGWVEIWPARAAGGEAGAAALAFVGLCTAGFAAGAAARAAGLALQRRGRSRGQVLWTDALGLTVPAAAMLALWLG